MGKNKNHLNRAYVGAYPRWKVSLRLTVGRPKRDRMLRIPVQHYNKRDSRPIVGLTLSGHPIICSAYMGIGLHYPSRDYGKCGIMSHYLINDSATIL